MSTAVTPPCLQPFCAIRLGAAWFVRGRSALDPPQRWEGHTKLRCNNVYTYIYVSSSPTTHLLDCRAKQSFCFPHQVWVGGLFEPSRATIQHVTQTPLFILHHSICWLMFPLRQQHTFWIAGQSSPFVSPLQITRAASASISLQVASGPTLLC